MESCSTCKKLLPLTEFAFVNKTNNKRHYQCNVCRRETAKKSYKKHKQNIITKSILRNKQRRDWYQTIKESLSCCVCGESDSACLDFHHLTSDEKEIEISKASYKIGKRALLQEMNKCACLCANCHRKYHAGRLNASLVKLEII